MEKIVVGDPSFELLCALRTDQINCWNVERLPFLGAIKIQALARTVGKRSSGL